MASKTRVSHVHIVTCVDNSLVEPFLTVGKQYDTVDIKWLGEHAHYEVRNDAGDLVRYGAHRFDKRPEQ